MRILDTFDETLIAQLEETFRLKRLLLTPRRRPDARPVRTSGRASIFLPLSFLTGFFGMNLDWSIAHVLSGPWSFFLLGIGSMALSAGFMWWWFRRKGWTGNDG